MTGDGIRTQEPIHSAGTAVPQIPRLARGGDEKNAVY